MNASFKLAVASSAISLMGSIGPSCLARADMLHDGGFEPGSSISLSLPGDCGVWSGDQAQIATSQQGITLAEGRQMIHFESTTPTGPNALTVGCELWQMIDLHPYQDLIESGQAMATGSGWFNRVEGNESSDNQFSVLLTAYQGDPALFSQDWFHHELMYSEGFVNTDNDPSTWQEATTSVILPANADFVVFRITATENIFNDGTGPEFDGHYGDGFNFNIAHVPAPGAGLLFAMGAGFAGFPSRRRRQAEGV